ncbi:MAG: CBS domain-containing protein [Pseudomonadota bacterium]
MKISQILASKSVNEIITVPPKDTVADATEILAEKGIGTVMVSDDGKRPLGILSERDIVRAIARTGAQCLGQDVQDLMTAKLVTCAPDDEAETALDKMTKGRFRHMPVVQGGALVGLISLGDVVKARLAEVRREKDAMTDMIMGY